MTTQLNLRNSTGRRAHDGPEHRADRRWESRSTVGRPRSAGRSGGRRSGRRLHAPRLGPDKQPTTTTPRAEATAGVEPLIIAEEQAFIDGKYSHARTNGDEWYATHIPC